MSRVEEAEPERDVVELGAGNILGRPVDLLSGASPSELLEEWPPPLAELPVEVRVVRNHKIGALHHLLDHRVVDPLTFDHLVRDAVDATRLSRDRHARILERVVDVRDVDHLAGLALEPEAHEAELEDPVDAGLAAGRLRVEDHAVAECLGRQARLLVTVAGSKPAQYLIVVAGFESLCKLLELQPV